MSSETNPFENAPEPQLDPDTQLVHDALASVLEQTARAYRPYQFDRVVGQTETNWIEARLTETGIALESSAKGSSFMTSSRVIPDAKDIPSDELLAADFVTLAEPLPQRDEMFGGYITKSGNYLRKLLSYPEDRDGVITINHFVAPSPPGVPVDSFMKITAESGTAKDNSYVSRTVVRKNGGPFILESLFNAATFASEIAEIKQTGDFDEPEPDSRRAPGLITIGDKTYGALPEDTDNDDEELFDAKQHDRISYHLSVRKFREAERIRLNEDGLKLPICAEEAGKYLTLLASHKPRLD